MNQSDVVAVSTPEEFLELLKSGRPLQLAEKVAGLTDAQRKKFSKTAQEFYKAIRKSEREARATEFFVVPNQNGGMARLGLLAAAPKGANLIDMQLPLIGLKTGGLAAQLDPDRTPDFETAAIRILLDRRPDWAQLWMERQIGTEKREWLSSSLTWTSIQTLLHDGLCQRPDTEEFATYMSNILRMVNIRKRPELIEDVWQQFRFDTGFFSSWHDLRWSTDESLAGRGYTGAEICYHLQFHQEIPRDRLLDECLGALWREFNNKSRGNLIKLHDKLEPDSAELVARQSEYIHLLQNPVPANVAFAIKTLKSMRKLDGFDRSAVIGALPHVFEIQRKTQPRSALSLLKSLTGKQSDQITSAATVATRALLHAELEIQEGALKLLESWAETAIPVNQLMETREIVSPVVRARIDALLGDHRIVSDDAAEPDSALETDEYQTRIEAVDPGVCAAWKLNESLAACVAGQMFPVVSIDRQPVQLDRLQPVHPIVDVLELIDTINAAMERITSAMDVERILDGISRLGLDHFPEDFEERVSAIIKRFDDEDFSASERGFATVSFSLPSLCRVIICWLQKGNGQVGAWLQSQLSQQNKLQAKLTPAGLLDYRADQLYCRLQRQRPSVPLLSLPTHQFGWINPEIFVDRLNSVLSIDRELCRTDLRHALWRLAPVTSVARDRALGKTGDLPEPLQSVVACALGQELKPGPADEEWAPEWLVASRAQKPHCNLPELRPLDIPDTAYGLSRGTVEVLVENSPSGEEDRLDRYQAHAKPMVAILPAPKDDLPGTSLAPLILARTFFSDPDGVYFSLLPDWGDAWLASLWPANPEPFLADGVSRLLRRMESTSSSWDPVAGSLVPLLRPDRDWSGTAINAIWLASFSRDADARAVATDALIEGIMDGRAHPQPLAEVLVSLCQVEFLKFGRLADALREICRVSNWAALMISEILNMVVGSWQTMPRDSHHLLGVLLEALMQVDGRVSAAARLPLKSIKGSSKTARLAKQLLALTGGPESVTWQSALFEGLAIRLNRAEGRI